MFEDYFQEALNSNVTNTSPLLIDRPIAVNQAIDISYPILTHENSRKIIQDQKLIAVMDCICRVQKGLIEKGCDKPLETCVMFGSLAKYFIDRGIGLQVSIDETFHIIDVCEEARVVTMPSNSQSPANICDCCPDCCIILNNLKKYPYPAEMVKATYRAVVDPRKCESCEKCSDRCPMDAVFWQEDGLRSVNQARGIGCGLCVSRCPAEAIHLEAGAKADQYEPPKTGFDFYKELAHMRGKSPVPLSLLKQG